MAYLDFKKNDDFRLSTVTRSKNLGLFRKSEPLHSFGRYFLDPPLKKGHFQTHFFGNRSRRLS